MAALLEQTPEEPGANPERPPDSSRLSTLPVPLPKRRKGVFNEQRNNRIPQESKCRLKLPVGVALSALRPLLPEGTTR